MKTINLVADELWRIKTLRNREALALEKIHAEAPVPVKRHRATVFPNARKKKSATGLLKRKGFVSHGILDCDIVVNSFDIYPEGWSLAVNDLAHNLMRRNAEVEHIGLGVAHTVCVDNKGSVYTWGWGERGQLGRGKFTAETIPCIVDFFEHLGKHPVHVSPHRTRLVREVVKCVAVGDEHSLALTNLGKVYSWGAGGRGQLGCGDKMNHSLPNPVLIGDDSIAVTEVACGAYHSVALQGSGSVYVWGSGKQLGLGVFCGTGDVAHPTLVSGLKKSRIRHVQCGWGFTLACTNSGALYSWGSNERGQLGTGDANAKFVPCKVQASSAPIVQVSCGPRHSAALDIEGKVHMWGSNRNGQLGLGDSKDRLSPCFLARLATRAGSCIQISCGWRHSVAVSASNEIWTWGYGGCAFARYMNAKTRSADDGQFESFWPVMKPFDASKTKRKPLRVHTPWSHTMCASTILYRQQPVERLRTITSPLLKPAEVVSPRHRRHPTDLSSIGSATDVGSFDYSSIDNCGEENPAAGTAGVAANPDDLSQLSRRQMMILATELGEISKIHGILGKNIRPSNRRPTSPRGMIASRRLSPEGKTRNEQLVSFLMRSKYETSPILHAKESGWDKYFTGKRQRKLYDEEYPAQIDEAHSVNLTPPPPPPLQYDDLPSNFFHPSSAVDGVKARPFFGERHSSVILRGDFAEQYQEEMQQRRLKEKEESQKLEQEELKEWRKSREGALSKDSISSLFSPEFLVSCSNEEVEVEDVLLAKEHGISLGNPKLHKKLERFRNADDSTRGRTDSDDSSEQPRRDRLALFRQQRRLSKEARIMRAHQASENPDTVAEHYFGVKGGWTGRRRSKIVRKRQMIEEEINSAGSGALAHHIKDSISFSPIASSRERDASTF